MRKHRGLRLKCKRNKPGEAVRFALQLPELPQMIHPLLECFDVTVQHCAGAATAHSMPHPMGIQPFLGRFFSTTDLIANCRVKNLRTAACYRTKTSFAQSLKCVLDGHAKYA